MEDLNLGYEGHLITTKGIEANLKELLKIIGVETLHPTPEKDALALFSDCVFGGYKYGYRTGKIEAHSIIMKSVDKLSRQIKQWDKYRMKPL